MRCQIIALFLISQFPNIYFCIESIDKDLLLALNATDLEGSLVAEESRADRVKRDFMQTLKFTRNKRGSEIPETTVYGYRTSYWVQKDPLNFTDCGKTRSCFFAPEKCDPSKTCELGFTFGYEEDTRQWANGENEFEGHLSLGFYALPRFANPMSRVPKQYIAVGLSKHQKMNGAKVLQCVLSYDKVNQTLIEEDKPFAESKNKGKGNEFVSVLGSQPSFVLQGHQEYWDPTFSYCMIRFAPGPDSWLLDDSLVYAMVTSSGAKDLHTLNKHPVSKSDPLSPAISGTVFKLTNKNHRMDWLYHDIEKYNEEKEKQKQNDEATTKKTQVEETTKKIGAKIEVGKVFVIFLVSIGITFK